MRSEVGNEIPFKMLIWDLSMNVWIEPKSLVQIGTCNRGYILKESEAREFMRLRDVVQNNEVHILAADNHILRSNMEKLRSAAKDILDSLDEKSRRIDFPKSPKHQEIFWKAIDALQELCK
jgi:hypothetical protein